MPNRLITSTSPYLLAHAHDPVDWYPWGPEALERARAEDKPIHLSIGYHACHWCHVLHDESFSDPQTAQILNDNYVNIKVDREERPDLDAIYMTAVQALTGGGGWPMTVFMTPDGVPFYGGTYFPPEDRGQMPAFRRVLLGVANAYATQRADLLQNGKQLTEHIRSATATSLPGELNLALLDEAYANLHGQFDQARGGFGHAPKFPQPMIIEFLLRYGLRTGRPLAMEMATTTLTKMAEGGMYDQLGGGFHRYSVDADWLVPHFEKMLYDNALLARVYVEAFQATADPFYRRVAEETLDYVLRELRHPDGGFYSTQDADSLPTPQDTHKEEGAFFVWTLAEVQAALGSDALAFSALYDVTARGNFEGKNILHVRRSVAEVARTVGMDPANLQQRVAANRSTLLALRANRPHPNLDDKVLTAWNGMAIRAFALAATAFDRPDYAVAAAQAADFVLTRLRPDGTLLRSWRDTPDGPRPGSAPAFLEDYALLADGLLGLYEATFDARWLREAIGLADAILARFWDDALGGFYDTAADHEALLVRPRDTGDNATPSGSSAAADVLLRLSTLLDRPVYRERALRAIGNVAQLLDRYPQGFGRFLAATEYALSTPLEIVVVGEAADPATQALLAEVQRPFLPHKVVALLGPDGAAPVESALFVGREQLGGQPTAYVCQNYACQLPVTDPAALRALLVQA